jgi:hypothetical protein
MYWGSRTICRLILAGFLHGSVFDPDDGDSMFPEKSLDFYRTAWRFIQKSLFFSISCMKRFLFSKNWCSVWVSCKVGLILEQCESTLFSPFHFLLCTRNNSAVGIATGYGLDDRGVWVRVPVGSRIFSFPSLPDRLWVPPNLRSNGYWGLFPHG